MADVKRDESAEAGREPSLSNLPGRKAPKPHAVTSIANSLIENGIQSKVGDGDGISLSDARGDHVDGDLGENIGQGSLSRSSTPLGRNLKMEEPPAMKSLPRDPQSTARALGFLSNGQGDVLDMVCIGFGPASLAIAIALVDAYSKSTRPLPRVLFIERQEAFAWHSGMQLPSAKMQISFLKDLATPRDPTSPYTFINYLHAKGRLNHFINLGTFLPSRVEYEDYMRWCADHFRAAVKYGRRVLSVEPNDRCSFTSKVRSFQIRWEEVNALKTGVLNARNVVVAAGGEAYIPVEFKPFTGLPQSKVMHSSRYATTAKTLEDLLRKPTFLREEIKAKEEYLLAIRSKLGPENSPENESLSVKTNGLLFANNSEHREMQTNCARNLEEDVREASTHLEQCKLSLQETTAGPGRPRFTVIGSGQSAAEIFNDLSSRFPDAEVCLIIKGAALRPSDDSPFVNEIFDPERVDEIYHQSPEERKQAIQLDRGTNYGVVRLELLEHIYEKMYMQRIREPDPSKWRQKIITNRKITHVQSSEDNRSLLLKLVPTRDRREEDVEELICSYVFVATGYTRNAYEAILEGTRSLLLPSHVGKGFPVGRDYRVEYDAEKVEKGAGVWLQGCNERTHGLSDTLLSILAVRGGEIVSSIFGDDLSKESSLK